MKQQRVCKQCGENKPLEEFDPRYGSTTRRFRCKVCRRAYLRKYHQTAKNQAYLKRTTNKRRGTLRKSIRNRRTEMLEAYGGKCICCGERNPLFLTLDHIYNNGAQERRKVGKSQDIIRMLKEKGWPQGEHQLLCYNCNCGRQTNGGICPHNSGIGEKLPQRGDLVLVYWVDIVGDPKGSPKAAAPCRAITGGFYLERRKVKGRMCVITSSTLCPEAALDEEDTMGYDIFPSAVIDKIRVIAPNEQVGSYLNGLTSNRRT